MAVMNLNKENFLDIIQGDKPVLVEFQAPWCTYCRRLTPVFDVLSQEYEGEILFAALNVDEAPELEDKYGIELIPTLVLFHKGEVVERIVNPGSKAAIESFLRENAPEKEVPEDLYDMVVIGGGPGGYTAALYAARAGLKTLVLEKMAAGGQMTQTMQIDNYPGFEEGIDGFTLGEKMRLGAERFSVQTELAEVLKADLSGKIKILETTEGVFRAKTVVISTGADHKHLGVDKEEMLVGKGVSYCAACDGMFYRGKTVAIVGGGNSAAADAMILSRIAKKVILIHRRDTLRATKIYHEPLMKAENVQFQWNSTVTELLHDGRLTGVKVHNVATGEDNVIPVDGLFVSIGRKPVTELFQGAVTLDDTGYILADETTRTNLPGVFAVGDVRTKAVRQIVTAVADGAVAAHYAEDYLAEAD